MIDDRVFSFLLVFCAVLCLVVGGLIWKWCAPEENS